MAFVVTSRTVENRRENKNFKIATINLKSSPLAFTCLPLCLITDTADFCRVPHWSLHLSNVSVEACHGWRSHCFLHLKQPFPRLFRLDHIRGAFDLSSFSGFSVFTSLSAFTYLTDSISFISGCRDGAVVRALASHQCGPGSIPRSGVICGLSLMVLFSAPRGFLRVLRFPLSSKTHHWSWFVLIVNLDSVPN